MSGGVRNLRAMFENKDQATSPPENRGRSPGAVSTGAASDRTSPRPLSKIRTSFVMVEKSGQMGLQKESSGEPSMSKRRESFRVDEQDEPAATALRKESIAVEFNARKNSTAIDEIIPESAIETPSIESDKQLMPGKRDAPEAGGAKRDTMKATASASSAAKPTGAQKGNTTRNSKPATQAKGDEKPTTAKTITRPAAISTAKTSVVVKPSTKSAKAPAVPRTPTTVGQSQLKEASSRDPDNKAGRGSLAPSQASNSTSQPSTIALTSGPRTRIPPSPPQTGFVKPKPRSPTRPVRLPASLTAHTASSGSKLSGAPPAGRQSLSRASGNFPGSSTQSRSPSRAGTGAAAESTSASRKPSTAKLSSRPSLGPPPKTLKKQPSRQSLPVQTAPVGDSFLARMMRPTTSSVSKNAEKPEATVPKKPATKASSSKTPAASTSSAAPKASGPGAISKPAAKDTKYVVAAPIKREPAKQPPNKASKEAPKEAAKETPKETLEDVAKPAAEPVVPAEPSSLKVPEDPAETSNAEPEAVDASNGLEPGAEETEVVEAEAPKVENADQVEEAPVSDDVVDDVPIEEKEVEASDIELVEPEEAEAAKIDEVKAVEEPPASDIVEEVHGEEEEAVEAVPDKTSEVVPAETSVEEDAAPVVDEDIPSTAVETAAPAVETEVVQESTTVAEPEVANVETAPTGEVEDEQVESAQVTKSEHDKVDTSPAPPTVEELALPVSESKLTNPAVKDPEDAKARKEIAKLNAEIMNATTAKPAETADDDVD